MKTSSPESRHRQAVDRSFPAYGALNHALTNAVETSPQEPA
jgi:hypothetical protein